MRKWPTTASSCVVASVITRHDKAWGEALIRANNEALEKMQREDPEGWAEYLKEFAELDETLMDGLDPDEKWDFSDQADGPR